jgi:leader peptidase (prepilin peptidase) / N-methyltransferase
MAAAREEILPPWLLPIVAAPFVGSFIGTLIVRMPAGAGIAAGRSRCDHCGATLGFADLVPILSWAWLRGRCRRCGGALGWFYPGVEGAAILVAAFAAAADSGDPARLWLDCLLGWVLLTAAWIDLDHLVLPDALILPLVLAGLAATAWLTPEALTEHALAAALGYLALRAIGRTYRRLRGRDGIGEGDAKLLAAAGAWLGLAALSWVVLIAALTGLAAAGLMLLAGRTVTRATAFPFGPFLAAACFALQLCHNVGIEEISALF